MALALMILSLALGIRGVNWLLANQGMLYLGVISYSIYLWHLPIVKLLGNMSLPEIVPDAPFLNLVLWALVPVMAAMSALQKRAPSSSSPMTGTDFGRPARAG